MNGLLIWLRCVKKNIGACSEVLHSSSGKGEDVVFIKG